MAAKIRLMRMGAKKKPFYRVVVMDSRKQRDGRYIENVGTYNPMKDPAEINLERERIVHWLNRGAVPTKTVKSFLRKHEIEAGVEL